MSTRCASCRARSTSCPPPSGPPSPPNADSLLSVRSFHGAVNVVKLLAGSIHLHDVVIDRPEVNLLQVNDSVANYQIVPTSEDSDTTAASIPGIYIDSFRILQAGPLRYRSLADSTDVTARLENVSLDGPDAPLYRLSVEGNADLPFLRDFDLANLTFGLDGSLRWSPDTRWPSPPATWPSGSTASP